jgi:hypothetical protein
MTPSPSFYVLTVSALYMALRAPQNRLADAIDLADGFACHLNRDAVERAKQRALEMFADDADGSVRRIEDILKFGRETN